MKSISLKVRYYQDSTPEGIPCREENFIRREMNMPLPVSEMALVVVDVWDIHHIESYVERAQKVLEENLLPVLEACRKLGVTVIHAPCPEIAEDRFPERLSDFKAPEPPKPVTWPSQDFVNRGQSPDNPNYCYRHPRDQEPGVMAKYSRLWDLSPRVEVKDSDLVVATGDQLDQICRQQGIVHLLYGGFLANWCVLNRDYGIREKSRQGYNTILMRDATMGSEYPDTLDNLFATEFAIREVETQWGFSASNPDFLSACLQ